MPLVSLQLVVTVCSTLPVWKSSSHAFSGALSCRCSCTQKPLPSCTVMALGQQGGVRNSLVVLALRRGTTGALSSPERPRSSVPFLGCAKADCAIRPAPTPIPARNCLLSILLSPNPESRPRCGFVLIFGN